MRPGGPRASVLVQLQRQLVGFDRVALKPGQSRTVSFALDPRSMSSVARDGTRTIQPGAYRLYVGGGQPGPMTRKLRDLYLDMARAG